MWPPIYQGFESHSCLYTEFTGAGEEKCMPNSCSVNTVQSKQGTGPTSLRSRCACMYLQIASNPLQDIATGLYSTDLSVYSQKEFLAMRYPSLPSSMGNTLPNSFFVPTVQLISFVVCHWGEWIESEKKGGECCTLYTQLPVRSFLLVIIFCHIIQNMQHTC